MNTTSRLSRITCVVHNIKKQITCHNLKSCTFLYTNILNHITQWLKKYAMHKGRATQNQTILWITLCANVRASPFNTIHTRKIISRPQLPF